MCGIVGVINHNSLDINVKDSVQKALKSLSKRGPDFQDYYLDEKVILGHARLAIIDTSQAANQPFWDLSKRYCIVFNGEIFNYQSLRETLTSKGYSFKTHSDTETLLYLLIEEGEGAISKLNGFFSFCFYDQLEQKIILARDRFGIKPLVYSQVGDAFIFASEIKAILPFVKEKEIDRQSLQYFFKFNYIPTPFTIFENIQKLEAAHYITLSLNDGEMNKVNYYNYYPSKKLYTSDYETAQKDVYQLLEDATQKRMIADVPIGSFLSGGIDSSIVSTIAAKHTKHLNTFSIGFKDEPYFDETHFANLVAKNIKSNHTVFSLSNDNLFEHYEDALHYFDEPFADSSALNMFILSKETKKKVTVVLSGDGADELFSGYNKHQALWLADQNGAKNTFVKTFGSSIASVFPKSRNGKWSNKARQLDKFSKGLKLSKNERYVQWASFMNDEISDQLTGNKFKIREGISYLKTPISDFNDYLHLDFELVLQGDMLRKVDAMSMAHGLEVRTPFLDYRLVDLVFSMPSEFKINRNERKKILKDAFKKELPNEIFNRGKHGFEVPLLKWFLGSMKQTLDAEVFNKELIVSQGFLNWDMVHLIQKKLYSKNPEDAVYNTWALLSFQKWLQNYYYN